MIEKYRLTLTHTLIANEDEPITIEQCFLPCYVSRAPMPVTMIIRQMCNELERWIQEHDEGD